MGRCLPPVNADFFLASVTENFSRICNSSGSRFLRPGAHFIFILVQPVAAKDMTLYKGHRGSMHQLYAGSQITRIFRPPGSGENVTWIVYPLRTGDVIAVAKKLNRGCAEGSPAPCMPGATFWFHQGIFHQR